MNMTKKDKKLGKIILKAKMHIKVKLQENKLKNHRGVF